MHTWTALPAVALRRAGSVSDALAAVGIGDFRAAARWVHELPYGRNADRADYRLVLTERRGTCSTKHALLASLANEQAVDVFLTLGVFEMDGANTPGIDEVLRRYGVVCVPEAHCYLVYDGRRVDVTRAGTAPSAAIRFLHEERIAPEQIGDYKVAKHRAFLRDWVERTAPPLPYTWEEVWRIREECIAALEQ